MQRGEPGAVSAIDIAVFAAEIALLAALAVGGARIGSGSSAVILAVALPVVAATLWARALAPRATRRVTSPTRLITKLVMTGIAAVLLALTGLVVWAVAFAIVVGGLFIVGEFRERGTPPPG